MVTPFVMERVLWLGIEDYAGLWEVGWELNASCPANSDAENARLAKAAVRDLCARGYLQLYREGESDEELELLGWSEASEILNSPSSWSAPVAGMRSIRFGTTEEGKLEYERLYAQRTAPGITDA